MSAISPRERLLGILNQKNMPPSPERMKIAPPPNVIPESMYDSFTLGVKIPVLYWYIDESGRGASPARNTRQTYEKIFSGLDAGKFDYYQDGGQAFFAAFNKYPISGEVVVWGLTGCNCEALAAWAGASKVFVIEYNKPLCEHEKIVVCSHEEFTALSCTTDFAISYSSFEHDGLGRYGDPLSPDGDLKAMRQAWNGLNDNGVLFLGIPLGQDCLVWNAHRIYGKLRLPMLLRGWQLLDVFNVHPEETPEFPFDMPLDGRCRQCLLVFRKIAEDWPDDECLLQNMEGTKNANKLSNIFKRINKIIYHYKCDLLKNE